MIRNLLIVLLLITATGFVEDVGDVLINFNFQSSTLPPEITTSGTISTSGSIGNCSECSAGRLVVTLSGWVQIDLSSCSVLNLKMKSSGTGARTVTVKAKLTGESDFTVLGTISVLGAVGSNFTHQLASVFPQLVTSNPLSVRLENAASGGDFHIHDLYAEGNATLSSEANVTSFKIPSQIGDEVINSTAGTISITVPVGTSLTSVVPSTVTLSAGATISPLATAAQDFSNQNEISYTVTAQDGVTTKLWKVVVLEAASSEKEILTFKLSNSQVGEATINSGNGTITVSMPDTEPLSSLVPVTFTLSANATIDPAVSTARDFSSPVEYTVTAQDNSTKVWTVSVQQVNLGATYFDYQAEDALFTGKIDNQHANYTGTGFIDFLTTGENYIQFTVCQQQASTETAKFRYSLAKDETRTAKLFVNDLFIQSVEFPRTSVFTEWFDATVTVALSSGINTVKLTWDETDGPNLDKLSLTGAPCNSHTLNVTPTNGGSVTISPERSNKKYFDVETVTLLAVDRPDLTFQNWSGDVSSTDNPVQVVMNADKNITANFNVVNSYTLTVNVNGIGNVALDPPGGIYTEGTVVTLTAQSVLSSTFQGWGGVLSGSASPQTITMDANKSVTATFASNLNIDFNTPIGFASVITGSGAYNYTTATFYGPTTGGQNATDTLVINGPTDFDKFAKYLYDRNRAYRNASQSFGSNAQKAPLVIVLKEGTYPEGSTSSSAWGNHMMTIQEQGDLTIIGEGNVVLNFGFNIKRSWNILIRNITFQDYYDDGINIGESETHHIWVDHCTIGHPTTLPSDSEHPDGGIDIKAGASYVTVSWCNYRNSWKTGLVGHSDSNGGEDIGKLKVTYYGNYFFHTNSRNPRVRFGEVHVLNNLEEQVMLYGIAAANSSYVYAENNFFLNTRWPMYADRTVTDFKAVYGNNTDNTFTSKTGNIPANGLKQVGNEYDDSGLPVITAQINPDMLNSGGRSIKFDEFNPSSVFDPHSYYSYSAFPASVVKTIVPLYAGAGKVNFFGTITTQGIVSVTGSLNSFSQTIGSPSITQSYSVAGANLSGNIVITPPANYEVSANAGANWYTNSSPLTLTATNGIVGSTQILVRLNAATLGSYGGNIVHASTGLDDVNLTVSGNTGLPVPTIVVNSSLSSFAQTVGSPSSTQSYIVSGQNLNGVISITPPLNYELSIDGGNNWYNNFTPLELVPLNGTISTATIQVRLNASAIGNYNGEIAHTTEGGEAVDLIVTGATQSTVPQGAWTIYEADVLPNAFTPVFATSSGTFSASENVIISDTEHVGNNLLRMDVTQAAYLWRMNFANHSISVSDLTVVMRVKGNPLKDMAMDLDMHYNDKRSRVSLHTVADSAKIRNGSGTNVKLPINITEWNVYRFVMSATETKLFVNESVTPVLVFTPATSVSSNRHFRFGDGDSNNSFGGDIDWIAWDVTGAFSPSQTSLPGNLIVDENPSSTDPIVNVISSMGAFSQALGSPSNVQTYALSGSNLLGNVTITPPSDYEVSSDGGSTWYTNASPLVVPHTGGSITSTTISVRLNATSVGGYSGTILHTSSGAESIDLSVSGTAYDVTPVININGALSAFAQTLGSPSTIQTYTVGGSNLISDIAITPPAGYQISKDGGATWQDNTSSLLVAQVGGTVPATTISVRLNAISSGDYAGAIQHTSSGAESIGLSVSGTVQDLTPVITVTDVLSAFTQIVGSPSATQTYTVSGVNLTSDITVTPPTGYQISSDGGLTWFGNSSPLTLTHAGGLISNVTITVRLNASSAGTHAGSIVHTSSGALAKNVAVTGSTTNPAGTLIIAGALNSFNQTSAGPSATQSYSVSGSNLTGFVTITPPAKFQISADGGTNWRTNTSPLVLAPVGGIITETTIAVRLNADEAGTFSGNITHQASGITTMNVTVTGTTELITSLEPGFETSISMSPNPVNNILKISRRDVHVEGVVYVYNANGLRVASYAMLVNQEEMYADVNSLANGLYIVEYVSKNGRKKQRIIKSS